MKKIFVLVALVGYFMCPGAQAQSLIEGMVDVSNTQVIKNEGKIRVLIDMDLSRLKMKSNQMYVLTAFFEKGDLKAELPSFKILGRRKNISHKRNNSRDANLLKDREIAGEILRKKGKSQSIQYIAEIPFEQWMEQSNLNILELGCKCPSTLIKTVQTDLAFVNLAPKPFTPLLAYIKPTVEPIKQRNAKETAFLNFVVNKTNIDPTFRSNAEELRKINNFIKRTKEDENVKIQALTIHGYASPEGSYALNTKLAIGRSEAMKKYIQKESDINESLIATNSTPEDWDSLHQSIIRSSLANKDNILAIITEDINVDIKEHKIRTLYPKDYNHIYTNIYPSLRRTDCEINFIVRDFSIEEAKEIFKSKPEQLSLNEMYLLAQSYKPGSVEFNQIFVTAHKLFANDLTASINAANTALSNNDIAKAKAILAKVEADMPEANNAKGVLAMLEGDFKQAYIYLEKAQNQGISIATENIKQINEYLGKK